MEISPTKVNNYRNNARKLSERGTPYSIYRRILDHLYVDLKDKRITALLLIEISRDMNKILYP